MRARPMPLFVALAACSAARTPASLPAPRVEASMVTSGVLKLAFHVIPGGEPSLLLEAGGAADSSSWGTLADQLAAATGRRVISYDRAGFGKSPLPVEAFTIADEVTALHVGVHQLGATKVIPIAASYGALIDVAYVNAYPADVVGLVLLDPMNADFVDSVGLPRVLATVPAITAPTSGHDRAVQRMVTSLPSLITELHGVRWANGLPAVIVSAATPRYPDAELQAAWRASHEALAKTPGATRVIAEHSDHDIAQTEPAVVVSAVKRVLAAR